MGDSTTNKTKTKVKTNKQKLYTLRSEETSKSEKFLSTSMVDINNSRMIHEMCILEIHIVD